MSKRKTKAQKIKIKPVATFSNQKETDSTVATISLYQYDPLYLKKDLLKTVLISLIILGIQFSIYFWLR